MQRLLARGAMPAAMRCCLLLLCMALGACQSQRDADFGWLVGSWRSEGPDVTLVETWSAPSGLLMRGESRFLRGGTVVDSEQLEIHLGSPPTYQSRTAFRLDRQGPHSAVFMNTVHDFPQRISYRRDGDRLKIEIALADGADARSWILHKGDNVHQKDTLTD